MKECKEEQILSFQCPVRGRVALLAETPDTIFSQEKIGCGVVVFPTGDTIYAPTDGRVIMIFPTEHAIAIECANGIEYFIHVGIGTAAMNSDGFRCYVEENERILRGERLLNFDLKKIVSSGHSTAIPIVFTNISKQALCVTKGGMVQAGEVILEITGKPEYHL